MRAPLVLFSEMVLAVHTRLEGDAGGALPSGPGTLDSAASDAMPH